MADWISVENCIFIKIVERRFGCKTPNGQNASHIGKCDIIFGIGAFEKRTQKVDPHQYSMFVILIPAIDGMPFVEYDDKLCLRMFMDLRQHFLNGVTVLGFVWP